MSKDTRTPPPLTGGVPLSLPQPLTFAHAHAMVAKQDLWTSFVPVAGGAIPGRTFVHAGQLADDRSALVQRHRSNWRKPTRAERKA